MVQLVTCLSRYNSPVRRRDLFESALQLTMVGAGVVVGATLCPVVVATQCGNIAHGPNGFGRQRSRMCLHVQSRAFCPLVPCACSKLCACALLVACLGPWWA